MEEVEDEVEDAKDDLSKATLNLFKASIKCPTSSFVTGVLIHLLYRKQVLLSSLKPMASANPNREKPEPECVERWTKQEEQDGPSRTKSRSLPAAQPRCQGRPLKETRGGKKMSNGGGRNCEQTSQKGPWQDPRPTEETTFLERKGAESSPVLGQHISIYTVHGPRF